MSNSIKNRQIIVNKAAITIDQPCLFYSVKVVTIYIKRLTPSINRLLKCGQFNFS
jgi:hypothetical protein